MLRHICKLLRVPFLVLAGLTAFTTSASAQIITWIGPNGSFQNAANWSAGGPPGAAATAAYTTAGSFQCTGNTSYVYCKAAVNGCRTQVTGSCNDCFAKGKLGCGV